MSSDSEEGPDTGPQRASKTNNGDIQNNSND